MKMKIRYLLLAILLITAILFSSCANNVNNQNTEHSDKESKTESSTNLPTEKAKETSTEKEDVFKSIRSSDEEWIKYGLSAYEKGKKAINLKEFFSNKSNMTYLTLYDHMFVFDKNKSVPIAEALFSFIYNKYGIDGITDIDKRCEYKTEYLKSLGLDVEYTQTKEVEAFFASMDFKSDSTCKYIMSFDNVTYYFIDNNYYFYRDGNIYGHFDDGERFSFFSIAVLEMIVETTESPRYFPICLRYCAKKAINCSAGTFRPSLSQTNNLSPSPSTAIPI